MVGDLNQLERRASGGTGRKVWVGGYKRFTCCWWHSVAAFLL
jgi:hypothetical protein